MEVQPPDGSRFWWNSPIWAPLRRLHRQTVGKIVVMAGWSLWLIALALPFTHDPQFFSSPPVPLPRTVPVWFMLFAGLGAFNLGVPLAIWLRALGAGYFTGLLLAIAFPTARPHLRLGWAIGWAAATCAGLAAPWVIAFRFFAAHTGFIAGGAPIFALGHLLICTGIWVLVPPAQGTRPRRRLPRIGHRLRRWLREL